MFTQRQVLSLWCRNKVEGRLAMKLRWMRWMDSKGVSERDVGELPALRNRTDGFLLARHSGME
jgi:hypothetical protein